MSTILITKYANKFSFRGPVVHDLVIFLSFWPHHWIPWIEKHFSRAIVSIPTTFSYFGKSYRPNHLFNPIPSWTPVLFRFLYSFSVIVRIEMLYNVCYFSVLSLVWATKAKRPRVIKTKRHACTSTLTHAHSPSIACRSILTSSSSRFFSVASVPLSSPQ